MKKLIVAFIILCFLNNIVIPVINTGNHTLNILKEGKVKSCGLPSPKKIDMPLEIAIARRKSVREFSEEPVNDSELSTILWYAYGYINGKRPVHPIDKNAVEIYVLKRDAFINMML